MTEVQTLPPTTDLSNVKIESEQQHTEAAQSQSGSLPIENGLIYAQQPQQSQQQEPSYAPSTAAASSSSPQIQTEQASVPSVSSTDSASQSHNAALQSQQQQQQQRDSDDSLDEDSSESSDLDVELNLNELDFDSIDMEELQKKQQMLLELREKKQRKLEKLLRKRQQLQETEHDDVSVGEGHSGPSTPTTPYPSQSVQVIPSLSSPPNSVGKRKRGRPRKNPRPEDELPTLKLKIQQQFPDEVTSSSTLLQSPPKRKRGRPPKKRSSLDDDEETEKRPRCTWTIQENRQLLKILESGKLDLQSIWDEMSRIPGNTKTYEHVRNKRANLQQKAQARNMSIIDVLKEDIVKLEGEGLISSDEDDVEPLSKRRRREGANTMDQLLRLEKEDYTAPYPSSSGGGLLSTDLEGKRRGPGRPRKYARAEDGSLLRVSRSGPQLVDYTIYYNQKLEEIRNLHEEDRKTIERHRQLIEEMQKEISFLQYTNRLLIEKLQLDVSGYEKFRAEQQAAKSQVNINPSGLNSNNAITNNLTQFSSQQTQPQQGAMLPSTQPMPAPVDYDTDEELPDPTPTPTTTEPSVDRIST
jgi:hypothetical protein